MHIIVIYLIFLPSFFDQKSFFLPPFTCNFDVLLQFCLQLPKKLPKFTSGWTFLTSPPRDRRVHNYTGAWLGAYFSVLSDWYGGVGYVSSEWWFGLSSPRKSRKHSVNVTVPSISFIWTRGLRHHPLGRKSRDLPTSDCGQWPRVWQERTDINLGYISSPVL